VYHCFTLPPFWGKTTFEFDSRPPSTVLPSTV
jgi:hypothetical protein